MSKNELAVVSQEELDALAAAMGASQEDLNGGGGNFLPTLKVWTEDDDDDEDAPRLKGKLFVTDQEPLVYAKAGTVVFRPLTHTYQWTKWDDALKKTVNRTRLIYNFREEARDELGTIKCGKPPSKDLRADPALAKLYEDVTTYRRIQGLVSYTGTTADGEEVKVENLLVAINAKGASFSAFDEEYLKQMPAKSALWDFKMNISLTKERNGSVTYWVMHYEPDFNTRIPLDVPTFETIKGLKENIDKFNEGIDQKYYAAVHGRQEDDEALDAIKTVSSRPTAKRNGLEDDLKDDDLPF